MDSEKIVEDLYRRFAAPPPEFHKRRIIFWPDEEREFEEQGLKALNRRLFISGTAVILQLIC